MNISVTYWLTISQKNIDSSVICLNLSLYGYFCYYNGIWIKDLENDEYYLKKRRSIQLTLGHQEPAPEPTPAPAVEEKEGVCGNRTAVLVSRDSSDVVVT